MPTHRPTRSGPANATTSSRRLASPRWSINSARMVALSACCALLSTAAVAKPPPVAIEAVDWGIDRSFIAERWNPVTLWLSCTDVPFTGIVTVEFQQDASQRGRIQVAAAVNPGRLTPVEVCFCPPSYLDSVQIAIESDRFRTTVTATTLPAPNEIPFPGVDDVVNRVWSVRGCSLAPYAAAGRSSNATQVPPNTTSPTFDNFYANQRDENPTVLGPPWHPYRPPRPAPLPPTPDTTPAATEPDTPDAPDDDGQSLSVPPGRAAFMSRIARIDPAQLPISWTAFDTAAAVVVPGDLGVQPESDVQFLRSGSLESLMAWVASGGHVVVQLEPAGESYRRFLDVASNPAAADVRVGDRSTIDIRAALGGIDAGIADTVPGRTITLGKNALRAGWSIITPQNRALVGPPWGNKTEGLIARGPVGLGMVTLVGFDPARSGKVTSDRVTGRIWLSILDPIVSARYDTDPEHSWSGRRGVGSVSPDLEAENMATRSVIDHVARVPPFSNSIAIGIGIGLLVFAALVGPIDRFLVRRLKLGPHAWITISLIIAGAGAVAVIVPAMARSGLTHITRLAAIDVDARRDDRPAWSTAVTTVWAGRSERIALANPGPLQPASWWRGMSVTESSRMRSLSAPIISRQGSPSPGAPRIAEIQPVDFRQWTARCFRDVSIPGRNPFPLNASLSSQSPPRVALTGLPPGAQVVGATLAFAADTVSLKVGETSAAQVILEFDTADPSSYWTVASTKLISPEPTGNYSRGSRWNRSFDPTITHKLPGTRARTIAIKDAIAAKDAACLTLWIRNLPSEFGPARPDHSIETEAVVRMLIPLPAPANP